MATFGTNHGVIASFVNQSQLEGRNPRDSLWFNRTKLYSYQSLMAIIDSPNRTLLINSELSGYSNTTTAHLSALRSIADELAIYTLPLDLSPIEALKWYWEQANLGIVKCLRARINRNKDWRKSQLLATMAEAEWYVDYKQISKQSPEYLYKHELTAKLFKHQLL